MIISQTPFRVSFFGGGTDFPEFYHEHGGATLLTTINQYCYISIHRISKFFQFRFRASYAKTELVQNPSEFKHPLIRECLLSLDINDGLEITHASDLPGRTGLGTSSAFTVGLLNALHTLKGDRVTAEDLAREAIHIERERVGDVGGRQDQYAAAYGGFIRVDFRKDGHVDVHHLAVSSKRVAELERHLLMFYTGKEKKAGAVLKKQRQRTKVNEKALIEMCHLVDKAQRIIVMEQPIQEFGDLLHRAWELKKTLSGGITNSAIDEAYDVARKAGASGGKILGAGGRGFILLFAKPEFHPAIRRRLAKMQEVHFQFSPDGSRIIFQASDS
jgi:D-glycero-alpha-D-manno-heptose-7-phosphate kinase